MISVYQLKKGFQKLLSPLLGRLYSWGVSPNFLTLLAIVLSLVLGLCLYYIESFRHALWIVPLGLLLRMALNALDGMMATKYGLQSRAGEMLNEVGDVVSDLFIYLPLMQISQAENLGVALFVGLAIINEFAGIMGKVIGKERRYEGPMGKSDRAFVIGLFLLISFFYPPALAFINILLGICITLIILSTTVRIRKALNDRTV